MQTITEDAAMPKITDRQKAVLAFIADSIEERGYPPTLREIGNQLGIRSTNGVNDHLRALERKGYLTREDMKSRTLRPTDAGYLASGRNGTIPANDAGPRTLLSDDLVSVPIIGRVAAGALTEAIQQPEDTVRVDRMLLGKGSDVFGLRVNGDSMIDAGILDGDYVFVRKQIEANRGEIVVALVGDEATCKYFFPEREHVRLQPANSSMAPILIPKHDWRSTQILGLVVGIYRRMN